MKRPQILQIITKSELGGAQSHVADLIEGFGARVLVDETRSRSFVDEANSNSSSLADEMQTGFVDE